MTDRQSTRIDAAAGTVTFSDGRVYSTRDMTQAVKDDLALRGLRDMIRHAENPLKIYDELLAGRVIRAKSAAPRQLDPWREAAAHAKAEVTVKAAGVRAAPGKKLTDHSDFKIALDDARQVVGAWDRATLAKAKLHIGIMEWHAKLTGADQSLDALFAAPSGGTSEVAPMELAEAAD